MPGWFPVFMGATFGLAMVAVGLSTLFDKSPGLSQAFGIAGIVMLVAHFAVYAELVRRWRRGGVVPLSETCSTRARRRKSGWFLLAAIVVGGAFYLAGSTGWGNISFGVIIGVETWYRLIGWTRPNE
ncbi:hypothetical protein DN069_18950 [Streptacidiphilus pinicola]|uniref:Uncharacterized protein n=1 Tax=Streptacidiphilus pinicola TaxID=2219663 RepID=A0A2X0K4E1_9ACTN|nr:hypothetical protein DN069_18950 [Streptacidiphilus pinicola]